MEDELDMPAPADDPVVEYWGILDGVVYAVAVRSLAEARAAGLDRVWRTVDGVRDES